MDIFKIFSRKLVSNGQVRCIDYRRKTGKYSIIVVDVLFLFVIRVNTSTAGHDVSVRSIAEIIVNHKFRDSNIVIGHDNNLSFVIIGNNYYACQTVHISCARWQRRTLIVRNNRFSATIFRDTRRERTILGRFNYNYVSLCTLLLVMCHCYVRVRRTAQVVYYVRWRYLHIYNINARWRVVATLSRKL